MANTKTKVNKNGTIDFGLCITVLLLLALGIIMVLSASSPSSFAESGNSYFYVKKQAIFAAIGLFAMYVISTWDYKWYKSKVIYNIAYYGSVVLLLLVPLIGTEAGRSKKMDKFRIYKLSAIRTCKIRINSFLCSILIRK